MNKTESAKKNNKKKKKKEEEEEEEAMIHFPNHEKGPKDKQINGSLDDIWPQALTGPGVFGMNVNVKSAVFFMCSEVGQSANIRLFCPD